MRASTAFAGAAAAFATAAAGFAAAGFEAVNGFFAAFAGGFCSAFFGAPTDFFAAGLPARDVATGFAAFATDFAACVADFAAGFAGLGAFVTGFGAFASFRSGRLAFFEADFTGLADLRGATTFFFEGFATARLAAVFNFFTTLDLPATLPPEDFIRAVVVDALLFARAIVHSLEYELSP